MSCLNHTTALFNVVFVAAEFIDSERGNFNFTVIKLSILLEFIDFWLPDQLNNSVHSIFISLNNLILFNIV